MPLSDVVPFGGGFLAFGATSGPVMQHVLTSPNGTDWTPHDLVFDVAGPVGIAGMVPRGPGLVGVGSTGYSCSTGRAAVFVSSDGIHWSATDLPSPSPVPRAGESFGATSIVLGPAGYVVLGRYNGCTGGSGENPSPVSPNKPLLWRSSDGEHWTFVRFPEASAIIDILAAGGPGFLLGGARNVGSSVEAVIWTSRDGATWFPANPLPDNKGASDLDPINVDAMAAGPGRILAVAGRTGYQALGRIWSSQDGITWQKVADLSAQDPRVYRVAWTPAGFVMAGLEGDMPGADQVIVRSSPDGAAWTALLSLPPASSGVPAIASNRNVIVVVGTSGQNGLVLVGRAATAQPSPAPAACRGDQLAASAPFLMGATGSMAGGVRVWNTSDSPCTLDGRPSVTIRDAAGHDLAVPNRPAREPSPQPFVLPARQQGPTSVDQIVPGIGSASLQWRDWCGAPPSQPLTFLFTVAGGGTVASTGTVEVPYCTDPAASGLSVGPFTRVPGSDASPAPS